MANRMREIISFFLCAALATGCASKREANRGAAIFRDRCAVCHSTGEAGGQGPGLARVVGRKAASGHGFGYSAALRASGLTWDKATLDRFLAAPAQLVPATTMPIATPGEGDRRALIAYLATLDGSDIPPPPGLRTGKSAFGDYRTDGP